jgi:hypothetical protein
MEEGTKKCPFCGETIKEKALKCRHCKTMLINEPDVSVTDEVLIKASELNIWKKILLIYPLSKRWMLKEFALKDGMLTITTQTDKIFQAPLKDVTSTYEKNKNDFVWIKIKTNYGDSVRIGEYAWVQTDEEWEKIVEIFQPTESLLSKVGGIVGKITGQIED